MSLPRYPEYKDSGVPWLGEVPGHWSVLPLARITEEKCDGPFGSGLKSDHYTDSGARVIRLQNIRSTGYFEGEPAYLGLEYFQTELSRHNVVPDDVLIAGLGDDNNLVGRACIAPAEVSPALVKADCFRFRVARARANPKFVAAQLNVSAATDAGRLSTGTTRSRIPLSIMATRVLALPPLTEQTAIATFLERETTKIDGLIAEQEKLLTLLAGKRQATISHAVTKGLNPAAPMKDSGVAWLGEVPAHWVVKRIKHLITSFEQGWSPQCESFPVVGDEEWGVLKVGCVNGGIFKSHENKKLPPELDAIPELGILKDDLLISRANTRELVGSAAVAEQDYKNLLLCDKLYRLRLETQLCNPRFLAKFLSIENVRGQIELAASGASSSMLNIGQSVILELSVSLPNESEQKVITTFLDNEFNRLDALTAEATRGIALLKERRSALISAAVTGKIDVRHLAEAEAA